MQDAADQPPQQQTLPGETDAVDAVAAVDDKINQKTTYVTPTSEAPSPALPAASEQPRTEFDGGSGSPLKKRKCAVFIVYLGHGYQGMQRNPGAKTIEDELFTAMRTAGAISEKNAEGENAYMKIRWSRSARTDKGVSALCQVVSMNFLAPEGVVDKINEHLPSQIRVLGYNRTVKGFDARKACDRRRYEYIFPEWMFDPSLQPTDKTFVDMTAAEFLERRDPKYVFDYGAVERMNCILKQFEGTHNFHNYTVRMSADSGQAQRYILSFECKGVIEIGGERWVKMVVLGQSFVLHQIRKMIGMAVSVFRGLAPQGALMHALRSRVREGVPIAPDLGLFLDKSFFEAYNLQWGKVHGVLDTDIMYGEAISAFKHDILYPALVQRDRDELCNAEWLRELYSKRVSFFHRYEGFSKTEWDYVYEGGSGHGLEKMKCANMDEAERDLSPLLGQQQTPSAQQPPLSSFSTDILSKPQVQPVPKHSLCAFAQQDEDGRGVEVAAGGDMKRKVEMESINHESYRSDAGGEVRKDGGKGQENGHKQGKPKKRKLMDVSGEFSD